MPATKSKKSKKSKKPGFMKDAPPFMKNGSKKKNKKAGVGVKKASKKSGK
jgi:hypothetical protein